MVTNPGECIPYNDVEKDKSFGGRHSFSISFGGGQLQHYGLDCNNVDWIRLYLRGSVAYVSVWQYASDRFHRPNFQYNLILAVSVWRNAPDGFLTTLSNYDHLWFLSGIELPTGPRPNFQYSFKISLVD